MVPNVFHDSAEPIGLIKSPWGGLRGLRYVPGYLAVIGDSWDSWVNPRKMFITTVYHVFYCLWSFYELQGNRWHDTQSRRQPSVPWSCSKPENLPGPVVRPYLKMKNEGLRWVKIDILGFRFQENKKSLNEIYFYYELFANKICSILAVEHQKGKMVLST